MKAKTTWSPLANSLTPSPASSTTPAPSWPSTSGSGSAIVPVIAERSEWHTPQAPRRTSTSPRFGASMLISSTWTGLLCSRQRTALPLRGIARKYSWIKYPLLPGDPHAEQGPAIHRRPMGRPLEPRDDRRAQRRQRRGHGTYSGRRRKGSGRGGARGARRVRGVGGDARGDARGIPAENFRRPEGARRRARQDHRTGSGHAGQALGAHPGGAADRELRELRETPARVPVGAEGRQFPGGARARRRGGGHHAVELSPAPDHAEDRAGPGRGLHRGAEAFGSGPLQRFHIGRSHRAGRAAEGRVQPGHGLRPERGRSAGQASRRRHDLLHRLDAGGQAHRGARRAGREARRAGARRQERFGDPRRRGSRHRGEEHGERLLPQLRPDLHGAYAHAGAGVEVRRSREGRGRSRQGLHRGRSARRDDQARAAELAGAAGASPIAQEEIFGPVLAIIPYQDEEEAVRIANDTVYGLAGAVWSKDEARAQRVARRIRAGQIDVNGGAFNMNAPFGGFKQSGHGREAGVYGLEEFLEYKSLQLKG